MISGKGCELIVDTYNIWLPDYEKWIQKQTKKDNILKFEITDSIKKLWILLKELLSMLEYKSEDIINCKKTNFEKEKEFFKDFGRTFLEAFGKSNCRIQYLHIIVCHTIPVSELLFKKFAFI